MRKRMVVSNPKLNGASLERLQITFLLNFT
jgi:hypothetical protein